MARNSGEYNFAEPPPPKAARTKGDSPGATDFPFLVSDLRFHQVITSPEFRNKIRDLFWGKDNVIDEVLSKFKLMSPEIVNSILIHLRTSEDFYGPEGEEKRRSYVEQECKNFCKRRETVENTNPLFVKRRELMVKIEDLENQLKQKQTEFAQIKSKLPNFCFSQMDPFSLLKFTM